MTRLSNVVSMNQCSIYRMYMYETTKLIELLQQQMEAQWQQTEALIVAFTDDKGIRTRQLHAAAAIPYMLRSIRRYSRTVHGQTTGRDFLEPIEFQLRRGACMGRFSSVARGHYKMLSNLVPNSPWPNG